MAALICDVSRQTPEPEWQFMRVQEQRARSGQHDAEDQQEPAEFARSVHEINFPELVLRPPDARGAELLDQL